MPTRTIYLPDSEVTTWDVATALAKRRHMSISKMIIAELKARVREDNKGNGVPVGFKVPASMKDPRVLARERTADDIRALVLDLLEQADYDEAEKVAES